MTRYVQVKFWVGVVAYHYNTCTDPMLVYDRDENATVINPRYGGLSRVDDILMRHL